MAFTDRLNAVLAQIGIDFGGLKNRVDLLEANGVPGGGGGGGGGGTSGPITWTEVDLGTLTTNKVLPAVAGRTQFKCVLAGPVTFTLPALVSGAEILLKLKQDVTGTRSFGFAGASMQGSAISPAGASGKNFVQFTCDGSEWDGWYVS